MISSRPAYLRLSFLLFITLVTFSFTESAFAAYCTSAGNNTGYEWIESITVDSFSKQSGSDAGYADFSSEAPIPMAPGVHNIALTPGFSSSSYNENWAAWIDFNQDQSFSSDELVFSGSSSGMLAGQITVPNSAAPGQTRMRIAMKYGGQPTPCEYFSWGEVEDYTVSIDNTSTTPSYVLQLDANYTINRSGNLGDPLTWVIEKDGVIVLERNASNELSYTYFNNTPGHTYRAWLKQFINGAYQTVSNIVKYAIPIQTTGYCPLTGISSSNEWVESVGVGNVHKISANNGGYKDFTAEGTLGLSVGNNDIVLTPGFASVSYPENWSIWLDLNQDNIFSASELLYQTNSNTTVNASLFIPSSTPIGNTRMRVVMSRELVTDPCGTFSLGEAEDYSVNIGGVSTAPQSAPASNLYTLNVDNDYMLTRTGDLGDAVTWVIEKDGAIVLKRAANSEMTYTHYANTSGANFRAWIEGPGAGGAIVSNIISYTVGQPVHTHELALSAGYGYAMQRSGSLGEALEWVIEMNGSIVHRANADTALDFVYPNNTLGDYYRVWLEQNINGTDVVVSNVVYYIAGVPVYDHTLSPNKAYDLIRTGALGDPVIWVIEKSGVIVLERNASNELRYNYFGNTPGADIRAWLKQFVNGQYVVVSNALEYTVNNSINDYALTLGVGNEITRSGNIGDNVSWVIERDGKIILERNASNELSYTHSNYPYGAQIRVYLQKYISSSGYRRVSNIIEYTIQ